MWHLLWFVYHHGVHRQSTTPYVAKLPAPLVVTAVTDAATAGYPQRRRDRFQGFVTIGTSPRNNCYEPSFQ